MTRHVVCVVGSINIDTTYSVRQLPSAGETILAGMRQVSQGGKGANQSAAAAASGGAVAMVAAAGKDDAGRSAVRDLESRGVDVDAIAEHGDRPTGSAVILVAPDGENLIVVDPGANALLDSSWAAAHVERLAPAVLLGQLEIPMATLIAAAQAASDATFVLNPAPMPADPTVMGPLLDLTDVLVPNRTELAQMVGLPEPVTPDEVDRCAEKLGFPRTLVVTLGADGAMIYVDSRRVAHVAAAAVEVVDTSGAGDAFCGALAHRLSIGEPIEDAVRWASELAGRSTTYRGARLPVAVGTGGDPGPHR